MSRGRARKIANEIESDIMDRCELKNIWKATPENIREEIKELWVDIIMGERRICAA